MLMSMGYSDSWAALPHEIQEKIVSHDLKKFNQQVNKMVLKPVYISD